MLQGEVWEALGRVGQLLGEAESAFLAGNYAASEQLLCDAEAAFALARELQGRAEDVLFESPLMAAADTGSIVDAAVRMVAARCPFPLINVALCASGAGEDRTTEEGVEPLDVRRSVG